MGCAIRRKYYAQGDLEESTCNLAQRTHRLRQHLLQRVFVARAGVAEDELGLVLQQRAVVLQLSLCYGSCRMESMGYMLNVYGCQSSMCVVAVVVRNRLVWR